MQLLRAEIGVESLLIFHQKKIYSLESSHVPREIGTVYIVELPAGNSRCGGSQKKSVKSENATRSKKIQKSQELNDIAVEIRVLLVKYLVIFQTLLVVLKNFNNHLDDDNAQLFLCQGHQIW